MRTALINKLIEKAEVDKDIFLICGDLGFSVLEPFKEKFPERFLNIGIAEQNMAGVAAGLAKEGFKVFIYSIGNFSGLRALEQIRYDICYKNLDVKIVSVGAGFAYGPLGCSHHATEDLAIMRALPNMTVYSPCDGVETRWCLLDSLKKPGPAYFRIGKAGEPIVHVGKTENNLAEANYVKQGNSKLIVTTGSLANWILNKFKDTDCSIMSVCKFNDASKAFVVEESKKYLEVSTYEEHQLNGGVGSFVIEALSDALSDRKIKEMLPVKRFGIKNKFYSQAGTQDYFRDLIFSDDTCSHE